MSKFLVIEILSEELIARIDFDLAGFHVNRPRFGGVLRALMHGRIGVPEWEELTRQEMDRMSDVYASYYLDFNEIVIDPRKVSSSIYGRSAVVHECVHAIQDLYHAEATTLLSGEVAAFIAQCMYLRLASSGHPRSETTGRRLAAILDLGNDLVVQHDLERQPGITIPHSAYQLLRSAVADAYPQYGNTQRISNTSLGVPATQARSRRPRSSWGGCSIGW